MAIIAGLFLTLDLMDGYLQNFGFLYGSTTGERLT